jgi:hypothetical protein
MAAAFESNLQMGHTDLSDRALVGNILRDITTNHTKVYYVSVFILCVCVFVYKKTIKEYLKSDCAM